MIKKVLIFVFLFIFIFNGFSYAVDLNGSQWVKFSQASKNAYVKAFLDGANTASGFLTEECKHTKAVFTKHDINYYVKQTTTFYQKYPYNKNILVKQVMLQMCDFLDMNVDEIARTFY